MLDRGSAVEFPLASASDFLSAVAIKLPATAKLTTAAASTAYRVRLLDALRAAFAAVDVPSCATAERPSVSD